MTQDLNALIERLRDYERWLTDGENGGPSIGIEDVGPGETWGPAADLLERLSTDLEAIRSAMLRYRNADSGITAEQFASEVIGIVDGRGK